MQLYSLQQEDIVKRLESIVSSEPEVPHFFITSLKNGVHGLCLTGFPGDNTSSLYRYSSKALPSLTLSPGLYHLPTSPEYAFLSVCISVLCWHSKPFPSWRKFPLCSLFKSNSQPGSHPKCWVCLATVCTDWHCEGTGASSRLCLPQTPSGCDACGRVHSFIPCSGSVGNDLKMCRTSHRNNTI